MSGEYPPLALLQRKVVICFKPQYLSGWSLLWSTFALRGLVAPRLPAIGLPAIGRACAGRGPHVPSTFAHVKVWALSTLRRNASRFRQHSAQARNGDRGRVDVTQHLHQVTLLDKNTSDQPSVALVARRALRYRGERMRVDAGDPAQPHHPMNAGHRAMQVAGCPIQPTATSISGK